MAEAWVAGPGTDVAQPVSNRLKPKHMAATVVLHEERNFVKSKFI
jgi:hypothetical protein